MICAPVYHEVLGLRTEVGWLRREPLAREEAELKLALLRALQLDQS